MKTPGFSRLVAVGFLLFAGLPALHAASSPEAEAQQILKTTGVQGGLIVHLGVGDGALTAALHASESFQVQGLDTDAKAVAAARESIFAKNAYGPVSFETFDGKALPYIDNLVNLVVAENLGHVTLDEVKRVLVPNGVAYIKQKGAWEKIVKPRPAEMDDWTHYFYDGRGNAVSKDTIVGPPERLQWVGSPRWSRHHDRMSSLSAEVSSGGRLFYIMDEGSRISILLPSKWSLIARDAFNGTILWKKPIEKWNSNLWPLKTGPTQLTRRLVGDGPRIFVTLGIEEPISCIDGATGKPIRTFEATKGAEEFIHVNGVLYALVNSKPWVLTDYAPKLQNDQARVSQEYEWDKKPRDLVAVEAATGRLLWKKSQTMIAPLTLASDGKRVVYYDGDKLICLDPVSGQQRWESQSAARRKLFEYNYAPRVILHDSVLLYAGGDGAMVGYDADSGKELWTGSHEKSGYRSPEDLIVTGGLVWNAGTTNSNQSGEFIGRDPRTGEEKKRFLPDVDCYWFHHRCYIAKATENFIIPSRTGIEYVDFNKSHWDINHWVRASCLYGVLPANGLTYAGPHNCACYPEAKLDGMNALAAGPGSPHPPTPEAQRLEHGPAWGAPISEDGADAKDWPTYRHDRERSGFSDQALADDLGKAWDLKLGGHLSAVSIAAGKLFVSQMDAHTLYALDSVTGKQIWHFIAGARVDSPPTYWKGRVLFGCNDGWVYCLRASDGALIWRFQGAPDSRRHMAFEELESVWPVHGSVLLDSDTVNFVSGRSVFLDGGLRFIRLDPVTGKKLVEQLYDENDPDTGKNLQTLHKTLQMPVGLNDVLSSDGKFMYLRSQKIGADGKRIDIAPVSGNPVEQGAAQKGEGAHLFAPMGFLDDTWFHRSYWVYGKHFAGGHSGYFQAGKYTPSGRLLVHDDKNVYGYARQPQYYKWTTTMEYELFAASKEPPEVEPEKGAGGGKKKQGAKAAAKAVAVPSVKFDSEKIDPSRTALTVEAWILPDTPTGVIMQHGGSATGYALALEEGRPGFSVRSEKTVATAQAAKPLDDGWHHLAGVLTTEKKLLLFVDGQLAAETKAPGFVNRKPNQGLQLGSATGSLVSDFGKGAPYLGLLDEFAIYPRALSLDDIAEHATQADAIQPGNGALVSLSFNNGDAHDESGHGNNGVLNGVETGKGKIGAALWFRKAGSAPPVVAGAPKAAAPPSNNGSFVQKKWAHPVPIVTMAMAMAGKTVFIAGPPSLVDEEYAFDRLANKDPSIQHDLAEQDAALTGQRGGSLHGVSTEGGKMDQDVDLDSPPVWDGMSIAQGRLYVATVDGKVTCYGKSKN